jgi:hypothetical protein
LPAVSESIQIAARTLAGGIHGSREILRTFAPALLQAVAAIASIEPGLFVENCGFSP